MSATRPHAAPPPDRVWRFGPFELSSHGGDLRKNGVRIRIQEQPLQILFVLLERAGEVVTREELQQRLWPSDTFVDFDLGLNTAVRKLRAVLGDDAEHPHYVETLARKGYRFVAAVSQQPAQSLTTIPAPHPTQPSSITPESQVTRVAKASLRRKLQVAAAVVVIIVAAAAAWWWPSASVATQEPVRISPLSSYPGVEMSPALSPDGTRVAYSWKDEDPRNERFGIFVKLIGEDSPMQLVEPGDAGGATWSPDGRYISFAQYRNEHAGVYIVPSLGGAARRVAETRWNDLVLGSSMSWSPDGKYIAYPDRPPGQDRYSIILLDVATLEKRQLTFPPEGSQGDLHADFSPDGRTIAFVRDTKDVQEVYLVPMAGGEAKRITRDNRIAVIGLAWTADGRDVLLGGFGLWRVKADGKTHQAQPVTFVSGPAFNPTVRGNRLAYASPVWNENIWRWKLDGEQRNPERLIKSTRLEEGPQFSPDGKQIAYQSTRTGPFEIWKCNRDGTNQVKLTNFGGPLTGTPHWSPDGKRIVFDSRPKGNADLFVVSPEGGPARQLTTGSSNEIIGSYSRDGRWIYFSSDRSGAFNLWKMSSEGGPAVQVTRQGGVQAVESEDGYVYYSKGLMDAGLWRIPVSGGAEEKIMDEPAAGHWGAWALANETIYHVVVEGDVHILAALDLRTRTRRRIGPLPLQVPLAAPDLAIAPDGSELLVVQYESFNGDLVLVDNFR